MATVSNDAFQDGVGIFADSNTMLSVAEDVIEVIMNNVDLSADDFDALVRTQDIIAYITVGEEED